MMTDQEELAILQDENTKLQDEIEHLRIDNSSLGAQMSVLVLDFMSLQKICKFGVEDATLRREDVINILKNVRKCVKKPINDTPQEAKDMLEHKKLLEQSLYDLLVLSWEWGKILDPTGKQRVDPRQVDAMNILPEKMLRGLSRVK